MVNQFNKFNGNHVSLGDFMDKRSLFAGGFTIEAWVKEALSHEWAGIVGLVGGESGHEGGWTLGITFDRRFCFGVATSEHLGQGQSQLSYAKAFRGYGRDEWHHLAGVFDGAFIRLFVNGIQAGEYKLKGADPAGLVQWPIKGELMIGAFDNGHTHLPFSGFIGEVRLWRGARDADHLKANKDVRLDPTEQADLIGYWPLCDGAGQDGKGREIEDWTRGQNGKLVGAEPDWQDVPDLELGGFYPIQPPDLDLPCQVDGRSFTLSWQARDQAEYYLLDVARDEAFSACLSGFEDKKIKGTSLRIPRLDEETTYFYRLRSATSRMQGKKYTEGSIRTTERGLPAAGFALRVDDSEGVLTVDYQPQLLGCIARSFTVQAWVKADGSVADAYLALTNRNNERQGWQLGCLDNRYSFSLSSADSAGMGRSANIVSTTPAKTGQWVHLSGVYSGSTIKLYINGLLVSESSEVGGEIYDPTRDAETASSLIFLLGGCWRDGKATPTQAHLAEVRLFDRALETEEITALMNRRLEPSEHPNLVACWRCDQGQGDVIKDIASGYHARPLSGDRAISWVTADLPLSYPLRHIEQVVVGASHNLALDDQGLVWAWGDNSYGQLGDGGSVDQARPILVRLQDGHYLKDIQQVAVGQDFSLALTRTGLVYVWGANDYGELGLGHQVSQNLPVMISDSGRITQIAAGSFHALALSEEGKIYSWGRNQYGQLGHGTLVDSLTPLPIAGLSGIRAIAAGRNHSVALDESGGVYCWGRNAAGQLGNNSTTDSAVPVPACDGAGVAIIGAQSVSAGQNDTVILDGARQLLAWGGCAGSKAATALLDDKGNPQSWSWKTINPANLLFPGDPAQGINVCRAGRVDVDAREFEQKKENFASIRFNPRTCQVQISNGKAWQDCGIALPAVPAKIHGASKLFPGTTESSYAVDAVAEASGYRWRLPEGTVLLAGQNTATVSLKVTASGELAVVALNDFDESRERKIQLEVSAQTVTFNYTGSIESFTVPAGVTCLRIEAHGAQGGGNGGKGARMRGDFPVTPGELLRILVGGAGAATNGYSSGGGGGSFVTRQNNEPLIIAGGGGGQSSPCTHGNMHATTSENGLAAYNAQRQYQPYSGVGGSGGQGGKAAAGNGGAGGAGLNGNGAASNLKYYSIAFINGGQAGDHGGFGGGGGRGWYGAGGGGGYSGGGGSYSNYTVGGGGGSFNCGREQSNTAAVRTGHGLITIQY